MRAEGLRVGLLQGAGGPEGAALSADDDDDEGAWAPPRRPALVQQPWQDAAAGSAAAGPRGLHGADPASANSPAARGQQPGLRQAAARRPATPLRNSLLMRAATGTPWGPQPAPSASSSADGHATPQGVSQPGHDRHDHAPHFAGPAAAALATSDAGSGVWTRWGGVGHAGGMLVGSPSGSSSSAAHPPRHQGAQGAAGSGEQAVASQLGGGPVAEGSPSRQQQQQEEQQQEQGQPAGPVPATSALAAVRASAWQLLGALAAGGGGGGGGGGGNVAEHSLLHMGGLMDPGLAWGGFVASGSGSPQSSSLNPLTSTEEDEEEEDEVEDVEEEGSGTRYQRLASGQSRPASPAWSGDGGGGEPAAATAATVATGGASLMAAAAAAVMAAVTPHVYWGQDLGNWMPLGAAADSSGDEGGGASAGGFWQDDMDTGSGPEDDPGGLFVLGRGLQQHEGGAPGVVLSAVEVEAKVDQCCVAVSGDADEACCICLDGLEERVVMLAACGHRLHRECLRAHVKASSCGGAGGGSWGGAGPGGARAPRQLLCPMCRAPMEDEQALRSQAPSDGGGRAA